LQFVPFCVGEQTLISFIVQFRRAHRFLSGKSNERILSARGLDNPRLGRSKTFLSNSAYGAGLVEMCATSSPVYVSYPSAPSSEHRSAGLCDYQTERIAMGLDATVYCDCWDTGKVRKPPPQPELVYVEASGQVSLKWDAPEADEQSFYNWLAEACDHGPMGELISASAREGLPARAQRTRRSHNHLGALLS
jgi:hypothetical protein